MPEDQGAHSSDEDSISRGDPRSNSTCFADSHITSFQADASPACDQGEQLYLLVQLMGHILSLRWHHKHVICTGSLPSFAILVTLGMGAFRQP